MTSVTVAPIIARATRRRLILAIIGLIAVIAAGLAGYRYMYNFFLGPFPATLTDLAAVESVDDLSRYYITISGSDSYDSGFDLEQTRDGRVVSSVNYLILDLGERALLVETAERPGQTEFTGYLTTPSSEVRSQIIADIEARGAGLEGIFLPMQLNDSDFHFPGVLGLLFALVVGGGSLWGLFQVARWFNNPLSHPIARALGRSGDAPAAVSSIDGELIAPHQQFGNIHLTQSWLVRIEKNHLDATRFDDIVWVYKLVTQKRVNGIPAGTFYSVQIHDRHGVRIGLLGDEAQVGHMLTAVIQRAPWALAGHSTEIEKAWKKNRGAVVASVEQRRQAAVG